MIKLQFIHCVNRHASKTAKIIKGILPTITLPTCQHDAEYYHLFMIFAVFDAWHMTLLLNQ